MSMREAASQAIEETLEPERRTMVTIEGDATVYADEPRIVQTFKNLIHAVSFPWSEGQSMNVRITTQTDKVVVNVTANRTPAAESAVARPVDRAGDTSGKELGLELSRTLIELHGGTLKSTARSPSCEQYSFAIPFHPPPFNSALEEEEW
jgi:light-regulated signal transduction histidine kinase (bacteriophytochrome)